MGRILLFGNRAGSGGGGGGVPSSFIAQLTSAYEFYDSPVFTNDPYLALGQTNFQSSFVRLNAAGNLIPSLWVQAPDDDYPEAVLGHEGNYSFDPVYRRLLDGDGSEALNYQDKSLSGKWTFQNFYDGSGKLAIVAFSRTLNDTVEADSVRWGQRQLVDSSGGTSVDWEGKTLNVNVPSGITKFNWDTGDPTNIPNTDNNPDNLRDTVNAILAKLATYAMN